MDTALGTFQADKEAAFTPTLGEVKPIDIFSLKRRKTDEKIVTDLAKPVARDGGYLHPPAVRDEGDGRWQLIHGHQRLEAWKRCRGEQTPIRANIYPPHTPDALITILEIEENSFRKKLTAAQRTAQMIRWVAAHKELNGGKSEMPVSGSSEAAESGKLIPSLPPTRGGRGKKGQALEVAGKLGIGKRTVNMRLDEACAAIEEKIDLDRDTPEELERKADKLEREADKRQPAEAKVVRLKRRKPAARIDDPTPPTKAAEIGGKLENAQKAFYALDTTGRRQFAAWVCLQVGLQPVKMPSAAVFGLADQEPELAVDSPAEIALAIDDAAVDQQAEQQDDGADLDAKDPQHPGDAVSQAADQEPELAVGLPAEVAPATDDALPEQAEHGDDAAVAHAEEDDEAAAVETDQGDNGAEFGAEDLQDAGDDFPEAADPVIGAKERCAHCNKPFLSGDLPRKKFGRFWHRKNCVDHAKPIAIAA